MSWSKTKYLKTGGVGDGEELRLQGETVKRVIFFKYFGFQFIISLYGKGTVKEQQELEYIVVSELADRIIRVERVSDSHCC